MTKKETYRELRERQQAEFNAFPIKAAFSEEQFNKVMADWGFSPTDYNKIYSIGSGCFIRRTDSKAFQELCDRHAKELKDAFEDFDFLKSAFLYELANHEYIYSHDLAPAVESLGFTLDEAIYDERLARALEFAREEYLKTVEA